MRFSKIAAASAASVMALSGARLGADADRWWHAMGGELGEILEGITDDFNAMQSDYVVVPSYRGTYTETMTGAIAAFRAASSPTSCRSSRSAPAP